MFVEELLRKWIFKQIYEQEEVLVDEATLV